MAGPDTAVSALKNIFAATSYIYQLHQQAKTNKKLSERLKKRIEGLVNPLKKLENDPKKTRDMEGALTAFETNLEKAKEWMETYTTSSWWKKYFLALGSYRKFLHINDQLSDTAEALLIVLSVEEREKSKEPVWQDIKADIHHLRSEMTRSVGDQVDRGTEKILAMLKDQNGQPWNTKVIPASELEYVTLENTTDRYKMYKGKYNKNHVLIKVMLGELQTDNEVVMTAFLKECKIMKECESPNILQVFGICFEKNKWRKLYLKGGTQARCRMVRHTIVLLCPDFLCEGPCYSLVTEYCEQGTLRDMLQRKTDLNWEEKLMMALDATRALYCIHHKVSEATYLSGRNTIHQPKKAILHGSLSSRKYLVKGTTLKLSGFEFSKTESSMRRNPDRKPKEVELAYCAPEVLTSMEYDERSEIFSLGVVIYEIVTGSLPLQGLSPSDFHDNPELIYKKLYDQVTAGLQNSCSSVLHGIIMDCLQSDPQERPNAGDIANRLIAESEPQETMMETMV